MFRNKKNIAKQTLIALLFWCVQSIGWANPAPSPIYNEPDSVYLFAYTPDHHGGLYFAYSIDRDQWFAIGPEHRFLACDYGRWGSEKKMFAPYLYLAPDGLWHCVWSVNERDGVFAHAASADLVNWKRQSYPVVMANQNCLMAELSTDPSTHSFLVTWKSKSADGEKYYGTTTNDFNTYAPTKEVSTNSRLNNRQTVWIDGHAQTGTLHRVAWPVVDELTKAQQLSAYKNQLYGDQAKDDSARFANLKPVSAQITVDASKAKKISDKLIGIFFEDINYAADGGLYAELVQNRDFEYDPSDKEGRDASWNSFKAWQLKGEGATFTIDTVMPIHPNNPHYAVLNVSKPGAALANEGFDGIAVKAGEKYDVSLFAKQLQGKGGKVDVRIVAKSGETIGAVTISTATAWKKQSAVITATQTDSDAHLEIVPQSTGKLALDLVSLFPQKTFKNRKNGFRADLAQTLADLHPRFIRFPGGCVSHGDGLGNIYRWKNTIGPLEARKPQRNLWGYHQTMGLGYFEYFQYCEDIGAEPLPVIAAGVPCQNSGVGGAGQQCGVPMCEMDQYVQDILDLIEWANGDAKTTKWGKIRAESGHPKPFNLKYVGIGNEDLITDIFEERFTMIFKAIKEKHPEITVIGTVGPFYEGTDYVEGWDIATKLGVPMVDEHYYNSPGWFIHNQNFYDRYDRSKSKVYLGEYAAHLPGRPNNIETALAEALYLTSVERNGDVVSMTSYAPLLAKDRHTQWNPNLIYFNNTDVKPTVGYEVQKLYGLNSGEEYLPQRITVSNNQDAVKKRIAVSVVKDSKTNDVIVKMVNLLPMPVSTTVDLKDLPIAGTTAVKTVLQGKPADRSAKPEVSTCPVSQTFRAELAPYSFTLIRIKTTVAK